MWEIGIIRGRSPLDWNSPGGNPVLAAAGVTDVTFEEPYVFASERLTGKEVPTTAVVKTPPRKRDHGIQIGKYTGRVPIRQTRFVVSTVGS